MSNVKHFAKKADLSFKIAKVKVKIPNTTMFAKKADATLLENKVHNIRDFVKKELEGMAERYFFNGYGGCQNKSVFMIVFLSKK